jgi:hypothetical protein
MAALQQRNFDRRGEPPDAADRALRCSKHRGHAGLEIQEMPAMPGSRLHPITIRLPTPIWEDVEKAAKADRRAVATYIALLIQDAVSGLAPPGALTTGVPAAPPPPSYTAPPAAPRQGAISDDQFRRLDAAEREKYTNVRGANGGEWIPRSAEPAADTTKPAAVNGAPVVTPEGYLRVGEMVLSERDIQTILTEKAQSDLRKTQIPANPESYEARLPVTFKVPDGTAFQFDENSPHYADARRWAHANGFSQNQFSEMLSFYASEQLQSWAPMEWPA